MKFEQSICINTKYCITVKKFFYIIYSHSVFIIDETKNIHSLQCQKISKFAQTRTFMCIFLHIVLFK